MVTYERRTDRHSSVQIEIPYNVAGADDMRNPSRSKFEPLRAKVTFRDGVVWVVRFEGRRYNEHRTWTEYAFFVEDDGTIRTSHQNPEVPPIVRALIEDAERHPAVLACRYAAAAAV